MRFATRRLADRGRECLVMENEKETLRMDELTEEEQVLVKLYRGLDRNTQLWAIYALNLGNGKKDRGGLATESCDGDSEG